MNLTQMKIRNYVKGKVRCLKFDYPLTLERLDTDKINSPYIECLKIGEAVTEISRETILKHSKEVYAIPNFTIM